MRSINLNSFGILARCAFHPLIFAALMRYPKVKTEDTTTTIDEWLTIDYEQTEIICKMLGCKCPQSHKKQQMLRIAALKQFAKTFGEYMRTEGEIRNRVLTAEAEITQRMREERKCHRSIGENGPMIVRCYCDEHAH